ncbi:M48 family metallopeptidase, partial [Kaarinaea lacus]
MSAPTFRLVFQGKIAPGQDLAEVKGRLQKLFKKDAATIDKMFTGKKIPLKQGLTQAQAQQYQEKMRSLGVLCNIESQASSPVKSAGARSAASPQPANTVSAYPGVQRETVSTIDNNAAAANQKPLKLADIDKAFSGTIPKVELPNSYKAGIVAVGITMVLLPIIYIGLISMLGYGLLSHSISNVSWMQSLGYKFGFIAYTTPIIVGLTVMLFMIKPLFARPAAAATTIKLDPLKEPIFFHFVNKIALAVGASRPKQIEVDCQVNASASFRKGLFSFFGDDLVLTIGMPLLAGFNARQLAGVLAHEFGHFSQGVGMRFHYLTYKVNSWFFNAVYLRDSWDEKLEAIAEEADGWLSVILNFARGGVWATRKLLYGFMMAGHAVSSYMLRQMEFDADRYEAHMAGSEQFKDTSLQLQRLGVAFQVSHDQLAQAWEDKKLVDNLPRLIAHNATQLPDELDRALLNQMREAKTQVYDSHPSDNERIDNAMRQQAKGIFSLQRESQELFKSFDAIAKQVSNSYYEHQLGLDFDKNKLVGMNQVVQITRDNEKQQEAYHQYFKDMAPVFELPISVNIFDTSKVDWDELLTQYQYVNEQIVDQIAQRRKLMAQANESYDRYQKLLAIDIFRDAGFVMFPEWFGMDEQAFAKYKEMIPKLEQTWQHAMEQLKPMFELNDERLSIALTLVNHPVLMERNPDHAQHLKIRNRFSLLINNFKRNTEYVTDFESAYFKLNALLSCAPLMGQKPEAMSTVMNGLLENARQSYEQLTAALGRLDYPFVAEGEHLTIADYIADFLPHRNHCSSDLQYYMQCGEMTLEKLESIYARIISGLANIALTIDGLIPDMNKPYHANEQVQVQQQVVNGLPLDTPSNMAYQQSEQAPAEVAIPSEEPVPHAVPKPEAKESAGKANFIIDESNDEKEGSE